MGADRPPVHGNRLVLAGAILYLLEWVAIVPAGESGPADPGRAASTVLELYTAHPTAVMFLVSWVSIVLIGRVLVIAGLRSAMREAGADPAVLLTAVAAMAISVAVELLAMAFVAGATVLADRGADDAVVQQLDVMGGVTWMLIFGPAAIAVLLSSWAMLRTRTFPTWISVVGLVGGAALIVSAALSGPGYLHDGAARGIAAATQGGIALMWLWMLAAGIFLVRRAPARAT